MRQRPPRTTWSSSTVIGAVTLCSGGTDASVSPCSPRSCVGNPDLFRACAPLFLRYLLLRHGIPATRAEVRVVGHRPTRSVMLLGRPRMYLSENLGPDQIDYLYSELTCVAW